MSDSINGTSASDVFADFSNDNDYSDDSSTTSANSTYDDFDTSDDNLLQQQQAQQAANRAADEASERQREMSRSSFLDMRKHDTQPVDASAAVSKDKAAI
jgi:hypothetical protein